MIRKWFVLSLKYFNSIYCHLYISGSNWLFAKENGTINVAVSRIIQFVKYFEKGCNCNFQCLLLCPIMWKWEGNFPPTCCCYANYAKYHKWAHILMLIFQKVSHSFHSLAHKFGEFIPSLFWCPKYEE